MLNICSILGCTVRAFDPTSEVKRPIDSYHSNLHYFNVGLNQDNGKTFYVTSTGIGEFIPVRTLSTLIHENEDVGKNITYLKIDIEGTEFISFDDWFKTDIFRNVDQLGMEIHIHPTFYNVFTVNVQKWFAQLHKHILKLSSEYGLNLVKTEPNLCVGKSDFDRKIYYPYNDLLFVK